MNFEYLINEKETSGFFIRESDFNELPEPIKKALPNGRIPNL
jgi:hypothetical protein